MTARIFCPEASGEVKILPSKSVAHRLLICAALSSTPCEIICPAASRDISATAECIRSLGGGVSESDGVYKVSPIEKREKASLFCGESGSTLRFLIPVAAALGGEVTFRGEGRLPERTCTPLTECLKSRGADIEYDGVLPLTTRGGLKAGRFTIPGNVSSQFITGLILALPLLPGDSEIEITGRIESLPYINITLGAVRTFGIRGEFEGNIIKIPGNQKYIAPGSLTVEGDWSNAAFWLCLGAMSEKGITVTGLSEESLQGDKKITDILRDFGAEIRKGGGCVTARRKSLSGMRIDASSIPDLVPAISIVSAVSEGETVIYNAERLRIKESDRIEATLKMLKALGAEAYETYDGLRIVGKKRLSGGVVDSFNDHRIAMSAAIAASVSEGAVEIKNPKAVEKSYGDFFEKFKALGARITETEVQ